MLWQGLTEICKNWFKTFKLFNKNKGCYYIRDFAYEIMSADFLIISDPVYFQMFSPPVPGAGNNRGEGNFSQYKPGKPM